jgi:hypothetical protein
MITHDRYQRVKEIFFSAQRYPTRAERSAFLTEACGDDTAMREEVESLLTAHEDNADFLSCPAYELAAGMLADETPEFIPGQEVDQYKIECFLSSGGMGQIYAAYDTKLGRKVAGIRNRLSTRPTLRTGSSRRLSPQSSERMRDPRRRSYGPWPPLHRHGVHCGHHSQG